MRAPRTRDDLIVSPRPSGDGVLVYDPTTDTGHVLEGTAAIVSTAPTASGVSICTIRKVSALAAAG